MIDRQLRKCTLPAHKSKNLLSNSESVKTLVKSLQRRVYLVNTYEISDTQESSIVIEEKIHLFLYKISLFMKISTLELKNPFPVRR